ncbi:hypothetical protein BJV82DRAFT_634350 [Fennellomyces sp. T-0311]|nr:hypothetical protein BJV82DRAFT_634350 [Fennellomyces sp. T-0311]
MSATSSRVSTSMRAATILLLFICSPHPSLVSAGDREGPVPLSAEFWGQIFAIGALVICSGIVAGLTLGLMSQDATNLAILSAAGTAKQKKHAARIMPIRKNGHLLLTALLLTNTVLNETLPILCDGLFGKGYVAVIISTALIVLFSEILPQAICSRHGLAIGAFFAIPVRVLIGFWYILAWPIAKLLDMLLGKHNGVMYGVAELRELIGLHGEQVPGSHHADGPLENGTVQVLRNTLDLSMRTAGDLVDPSRQPFMLHVDTQLDRVVMNSILQSDCVSIPVYKYSKSNDDDDDVHGDVHRILLGVLRTKCLSILDPADKTPLKKIALEPLLQVPAATSAITLLQLLQNNPSRMAEVYMPIKRASSEGATMSCSYPSNEHSLADLESKKCNSSYLSERSSNASCCITRIFRHHRRSNEHKSNEGQKDSISQQVPDLRDSYPSSYCEPYVRESLILGVVTLDELLAKLTAGGEEDITLTNILIHSNEGHDAADKESIHLHHETYMSDSRSDRVIAKQSNADKCRSSVKSSNSSTTESTAISTTHSQNNGL